MVGAHPDILPAIFRYAVDGNFIHCAWEDDAIGGECIGLQIVLKQFTVHESYPYIFFLILECLGDKVAEKQLWCVFRVIGLNGALNFCVVYDKAFVSGA